MTQIVYQNEVDYSPNWDDSLNNYIETQLDGGIIIKAPLFKPTNLTVDDYLKQRIAKIDGFNDLDVHKQATERQNIYKLSSFDDYKSRVDLGILYLVSGQVLQDESSGRFLTYTSAFHTKIIYPFAES